MKIYITTAADAHPLLDKLLGEKLGDYRIDKNQFGKPYIRGNRLYFNISHSKRTGCVALSESPVGVDIEDIRGINYKRLLRSFPESERAEIESEAEFLRHFTAREAYIKNLGLSLFAEYKKLSYVGGELYVGGVKTDKKITLFTTDGYVLCVCGDGDIEIIN